MGERVLVIGLDGFELSVAERLMGNGRMPHFERMREQAACVDLDHGYAKHTGLAWEHFSTGLSPAGAARWSAVEFSRETYECTQQPTTLAPFPAHRKFATVVFDAPYFDLGKAPGVRGMVSWGAHDPGTDEYSRPSGLRAEILERFGPYPAKPFIYGFTWPSAERTREMGVALTAATRLRTDISEWLLGERCPDWNLGIVVISELHSAIEALWHGVDEAHPLHGLPSAEPARMALESVYMAVDDLIGSLTERFPDALHVLFSMHGMGPNAADVPAMALLPEWLYRRAFGAGLMEGSPTDPLLSLCQEQAESWTHHVRKRWQGGPTPTNRWERWQTRGRRLRGGTTAASGTSLSWMPAAWYAPYWRDMPAFAIPAFYDGQIRLNVRGRECNGQVAVADYDAVCSETAALLSACVDPQTGRSVVREVVHTHPGDPMALNATEADMVIIWEGAPRAFESEACGTIGPFAPRRSGGHTGGFGIALWSGPEVTRGKYGKRSAFDVVPTLLEYLGSPSSGTDGTSFLDSILTRKDSAR